MSSKTFEGIVDRYNGITVISTDEPCYPSLFLNQLTDSLKKWTDENRRCIWFKISIEDAAWVPLLAQNGFNFHHTREKYLVMYKWLPTSSSPNLPPACHTAIGVGGLVFNENNQILVVKEKHFEFSHWKLPGGYVERGEDIRDAALREVKEETNIDAEFESLVTFRHTHNVAFGNSDIYIIVMLKATSSSINKCEQEIMDCKWMNVEEYLNDENVIEFNHSIVKQALDLQKRNLKLNLEKRTVKVSKWTREITSLKLEDL